jgi:hypothetical protein
MDLKKLTQTIAKDVQSAVGKVAQVEKKVEGAVSGVVDRLESGGPHPAR